jgi:hypothetical protein
MLGAPADNCMYGISRMIEAETMQLKEALVTSAFTAVSHTWGATRFSLVHDLQHFASVSTRLLLKSCRNC